MFNSIYTELGLFQPHRGEINSLRVIEKYQNYFVWIL